MTKTELEKIFCTASEFSMGELTEDAAAREFYFSLCIDLFSMLGVNSELMHEFDVKLSKALDEIAGRFED